MFILYIQCVYSTAWIKELVLQPVLELCFNLTSTKEQVFVQTKTSGCLLFLLLQGNWKEVVDSFDDMNLRENLLRGIYAYGFEKPSAIQQRAILPCIKGMYL